MKFKVGDRIKNLLYGGMGTVTRVTEQSPSGYGYCTITARYDDGYSWTDYSETLVIIEDPNKLLKEIL